MKHQIGRRAVYATLSAMLPMLPQVAHSQGPTEVAAAGQPGGLEEIVVTAQRREQLLQQVPISITTFNANALSALTAEDLGDLDEFTPGLTVGDSAVTQPRYTIRGVQTDDFGIGTEPSVGVFVDGVYSARSGAALIFFNDVARVEVLKGPQGTLFGRNTSAGAISIISNKPDDRLAARATLQIGNYDKRRLDATVNLPLTDTVALRLNGLINRRDGYLRDAITGEDREREHNMSGRAALRFSPSADTDLILAYDHDDTDEDAPASIGISRFALSQDPFGPFANDVLSSREARILNDVSLTAMHRFGPVTATSITAYKAFKTRNRQDEDGTAEPTRYLDTENIERNRSFSQELRLGYVDDRWDVLLGASYFHERGRQTSAVTALTDSVNRLLGATANFPIFTALSQAGRLPVFGIPFREDMNNLARNNSYAVYGDATYRLSDKLRFTAGLRYTHDEKRFTWDNARFISPGLEAISAPGALYNAIARGPLFPAAATVSVATFYRTAVRRDLVFDAGALEGVPFTRREKFNDLSPRFVLQYEPSRDLNFYISAARGYKAGGFNSVQINSFFDPENVWSLEGGMKAELFDRRLRFNVSTYYFKYKNRQSISLEGINSQIPQYITRSGDSEAYGADLEVQLVVTPELRLSAAAGAIDSTWVTRTERGIDISGQPTGEPRFKGVLSGRYERAIDRFGTMFADATYSYTSRGRRNAAIRDSERAITPFVDANLFRVVRADRNIVNAKIGWRSPGDHLSISLWAENLFDARRPRGINNISADIFQTPYLRIDRPRFFGAELGFRY